MATNVGQTGQETRGGANATFNFQADVANAAVSSVLNPTVRDVNAQGGQTASGPVERAPISTASFELPAFLQKAFDQDLQKQQQGAFWAGLTAARSGQAVEEIAKNRPWYSGLFGPDKFVEGAQFYTSQEKLAQWELRTLQDMNELRKMPGSEIGPLLNQVAQEHMTGDAGTNALIQRSMIERAGPLVDQHTKARYAWLNAEAVKAQAKYVGTAAQVYQQQAQNYAALSDADRQDPTNSAGMAQAERQLIQAMALPDGQTDESAMKFWETAILQAGQQGNFHAVSALRNAGFLGAMPPEKQKSIEEALDRMESRVSRKALATNYAVPMGLWGASAATGARSPLELINEANRINERGRLELGIQGDLIPTDMLKNGIQSSATAMLRAEERQADRNWAANQKAISDAEKQKAKDATTVQLVRMWSTGNAGPALAMEGISAEQVQSAGAALERQLGPDEWRGIAIQNFNQTRIVNQPVAQKYQAAVAATLGEDWSDAFNNTYEQWQQMYTAKNGQGAAAGYWGEFHLPMMNMHALIAGGTPKEMAYRKAFGDPTRWGSAQLEPEDRKDAWKQIDSVMSDKNAGWWSADKLSDSSKGVMRNAMGLQFAMIRKNDPAMPIDAAAKQAYDYARANGLEHYGAWAWQNPKGALPLSAMAGVADSDASELLNVVVREKAAAAGVKTTYFKGNVPSDVPYTVFRYPDEGGLARMRIDFLNDDGETATIVVSSQDLKDRRDKIARRERAPINYKATMGIDTVENSGDLW